jgi:hypothetical protein
MCSCLSALFCIIHSSFVILLVYSVFILLIKRMYAYHAAPWSDPFNERDSKSYSVHLDFACFSNVYQTRQQD